MTPTTARRALPGAGIVHPEWPPSWRSELKRLRKPRDMVLAALLLTYIWRFHDLTPFLSPLRIAAVATVLSWAYLVFNPRIAQLRKVLRYPYVWCFLLFSLWAAATVPFALQPSLAWAAWWEGHFKTITMFLFMLTCLTTLNNVRFAVAAQVFGGAVLAFFYAKSGFSQQFTPVPSYDRNDFALALNVILALTLYLAFASRGKHEKWLLWGAAGIMALCVMMSQSRGGFLTLAGIVLFTMVRVRGIKLRYRLLPPIIVAVSLLFVPAEIKDRLGTLLNPTEDYNFDHEVGRIAIWKRGLRYLGDRPVMGVGMENFPVAEAMFGGLARNQGKARGAVTHNSFLQVAVEVGLPGIFLYMAMLGSAVLRLGRLRTRFDRLRADPQARDLVLAADFTMVSILGFCIGGFFLSMGYTPMVFSLMALTAGLEVSGEKWLQRRRKLREWTAMQGHPRSLASRRPVRLPV